jgi:hypothetical protein
MAVECPILTPDGKLYQPLAAQSAFHGSSARCRALIGAFGCVAPETIVEGVPIAERAQSGLVSTLFGEVVASPGFCKGRAALYRVRTLSGREVMVTERHRFLTPRGWRPLGCLGVGDVIAADGSGRECSGTRTASGSPAGCSLGSRRGGGLPSPEAMAAQGILQRLRMIAGGNSASELFSLLSIGDFACPVAPRETCAQLLWFADGDESLLVEPRSALRGLEASRRQGSASPILPTVDVPIPSRRAVSACVLHSRNVLITTSSSYCAAKRPFT